MQVPYDVDAPTPLRFPLLLSPPGKKKDLFILETTLVRASSNHDSLALVYLSCPICFFQTFVLSCLGCKAGAMRGGGEFGRDTPPNRLPAGKG